MNDRLRFYEIDLLRFLAAFSVVVFHYLFRGYAADDMTILAFESCEFFAKYGFLGFHLFFIISGFVILLTAYGKSTTGFVVSRITRLFPAYWVAVTMTFLVIVIWGMPRYSANFMQYLLNLTMLQSFIGVEPIDGVYWTLAVELKFYFLVFLVLLFGQIRKIKLILYFWLFLTIVLTAFNIKYVGFFLFPKWSYYFIAGAIFFIIYKEGASLDKIIALLITYLLAILSIYKGSIQIQSEYGIELNLFVLCSLIFSFYCVFFLIATKRSKSLSYSYFYYLGILTYPLYLIHQNIGFILFNKLGPYGINKYAILLFVLTLMVVLSYAIHFSVEKRYSKKLSDMLCAVANVRYLKLAVNRIKK